MLYFFPILLPSFLYFFPLLTMMPPSGFSGMSMGWQGRRKKKGKRVKGFHLLVQHILSVIDVQILATSLWNALRVVLHIATSSC
jgi:hypothetical protein